MILPPFFPKLYDKRVKLVTLCAFSLCFLTAQPAPDPAATSRKAVDLLIGEKYSEVFKMFSPDLQVAIPEAQLAKIGATIKGWGPLGNIGTPELRKSGPNTVVVLP